MIIIYEINKKDTRFIFKIITKKADLYCTELKIHSVSFTLQDDHRVKMNVFFESF